MAKRTIRDERRDPKRSLLSASDAVARARRRGRVVDNQRIQRRPFHSGDPRSASETLISESELDTELQNRLDTIEQVIVTNPGQVIRTYEVGVSVGDFVFLNNSGNVDKASASLGLDFPAVGVVVSLDDPQPGQCILQYDGDADLFSSLVPGSEYILSRDVGKILRVDDTGNPDYPVNGDFVQAVGYAVTSSILFVRVSSSVVGLA